MKDTTKKIGFVILGVLLAVLFSLPYLILRDGLAVDPALGYIGVFVFCLISNISVLIPSSATLAVIAASTALNPLLCIFFGGLGTAVGEQISYFCGRVGSMGINHDSTKEKVIFQWVSSHCFLTVFVFAFLPLPLFDIAGISAGIVKMNWLKYATAVILGKTLKFALALAAVYYLLPVIANRLPGSFGEALSSFCEDMR